MIVFAKIADNFLNKRLTFTLPNSTICGKLQTAYLIEEKIKMCIIFCRRFSYMSATMIHFIFFVDRLPCLRRSLNKPVG